jgi:hypothetical protein
MLLGLLACGDDAAPPAAQHPSYSQANDRDDDRYRDDDRDRDRNDEQPVAGEGGDGASGTSGSGGGGSGGTPDSSVVDGCEPGTAGPECTACSAGEHCAGGDTGARPCALGSWDHDSDPATNCKGQTICLAGEQILEPGDALRDRTCEACPAEHFSTATNSDRCAPWTDCELDYYIASNGALTADRRCRKCPISTSTYTLNSARCYEEGECPPEVVDAGCGF